MAQDWDLLVIGGGSGGLACAQRAAKHGARVALAEPGPLGGTCVNVGCVPKKIMYHAADLAHGIADARDYGFDVTLAGHDWRTLKDRRDAYVLRLRGIYLENLLKSGVTLLRERARIDAPGRVAIAGAGHAAKHIVVATGGAPLVPEIAGRRGRHHVRRLLRTRTPARDRRDRRQRLHRSRAVGRVRRARRAGHGRVALRAHAAELRRDAVAPADDGDAGGRHRAGRARGAGVGRECRRRPSHRARRRPVARAVRLHRLGHRPPAEHGGTRARGGGRRHRRHGRGDDGHPPGHSGRGHSCDRRRDRDARS